MLALWIALAAVTAWGPDATKAAASNEPPVDVFEELHGTVRTIPAPYPGGGGARPSTTERLMDADGPVSEFVAQAPSPRLRGVADRYLGYRMTGLAPGRHRGLPSRHQTFIVSIGPPIVVVEQTDPSRPPETYRCVLSGLQASPATIECDETQEGVAIELTPLGCRVLFGAPARVLWDRSLECSQTAGRPNDALWERLQEPATWSERFEICDEVLTIAGTPIVLPTSMRDRPSRPCAPAAPPRAAR